MRREFRLPDVGEGVAEAELLTWYVAEGETVAEDEPVAEVETDKATVDIPSPVDGTVAERRAEEGTTVQVGDTIVVFETEAADPGGVGATDDAEAVAERDAGETVTGEVTPQETPGAGGEGQSREGEAGTRDWTLAVPATRHLARELGVDIDAVPATEYREGEALVTAEAVRQYAETRPVGTAGGPGEEADTGESGDAQAREERVPYRGIRRRIGEQMERAKYTAPHVSHFDVADAGALVEVRRDLAEHARERGVRLTYTAFLLEAVTAALQEYPYVNATLDEDEEEVVLKNYYNVGFATATEDGLLVPVVDDVDEKSLLEVAAEVERLAERARERTISPGEMQGGTFTVTNIGDLGGEFATPIVNYPEVAILGVGSIRRRPRVVDREVVPRQTAPLSVSFDHRVVDGATVARFTNRVAEYIEDPSLFLLE